jgi:hypothetical protein
MRISDHGAAMLLLFCPASRIYVNLIPLEWPMVNSSKHATTYEVNFQR